MQMVVGELGTVCIYGGYIGIVIIEEVLKWQNEKRSAARPGHYLDSYNKLDFKMT